VERGLSLFDLPQAQVQADLGQWQPILDWLEPVLRPQADMAAVVQVLSKPTPRPRGDVLAPLERTPAGRSVLSGLLDWLRRPLFAGEGRKFR
jgi:chromosome partitioning protein